MDDNHDDNIKIMIIITKKTMTWIKTHGKSDFKDIKNLPYFQEGHLLTDIIRITALSAMRHIIIISNGFDSTKTHTL